MNIIKNIKAVSIKYNLNDLQFCENQFKNELE